MPAPSRVSSVSVPLVPMNAACAQRVALASPEDRVRGLFFHGLRAAAERCRCQSACTFAAQLEAAAWVPFINYAVATFLPLGFHAAALLGGPSLDDGFRALGRQGTRDFLCCAVGRTLVALSRGNPRRLMNALPTGYRSAVSYGERTVTWLGPAECRFSMRRDFMPPAYHEGVILEAMAAIGVHTAQAQGTALGPLDVDYHVRWS